MRTFLTTFATMALTVYPACIGELEAEPGELPDATSLDGAERDAGVAASDANDAGGESEAESFRVHRCGVRRLELGVPENAWLERVRTWEAEGRRPVLFDLHASEGEASASFLTVPDDAAWWLEWYAADVSLEARLAELGEHAFLPASLDLGSAGSQRTMMLLAERAPRVSPALVPWSAETEPTVTDLEGHTPLDVLVTAEPLAPVLLLTDASGVGYEVARCVPPEAFDAADRERASRGLGLSSIEAHTVADGAICLAASWRADAAPVVELIVGASLEETVQILDERCTDGVARASLITAWGSRDDVRYAVALR